VTPVMLRGLRERRGRTLSILVSVVLGVALVAGTYVFTDTINRTFDSVVADANARIDVAVTPREPEVEGGEAPTLPQDALARVAAVPGVAAAEGELSGPATIVDDQGESLSSLGAQVASAVSPRFDAFSYEGRRPRTADEVALDAGTAERGAFTVGDRVRIAANGPAKAYTVVGIASLGGTSIALLTLPETQRILDLPGRLWQIDVAAAEGTPADELRARVAGAVGAGAVVRTGEQQTRETQADIRESLSFLTTLLLVFGVISLVVGAFSIFNTFSITVAQRTRQFALLRTVGASRGQVLRAVVLEALLIGLVGSVLGVLAGIALAPALAGLFRSAGLDLPSSGTVLETRTIVVSLGIGLLATFLAALVPALRATRVPPVAALRDGALLPASRGGRRRTLIGAVLTALGVGLLVLGLLGGGGTNQVLSTMGAGALLVFVGVAALSPALVPGLAAVFGRPLERTGGVAGRLARGNAVRNPGRTASTASALMIGVAVVALVTMLAAGLKASFSGAFEDAIAADLVVVPQTGQTPTAVREEIAGVPGVAAVSPLPFTPAQLAGDGQDVTVGGLDPATAPQVIRVPWTEGSDATLRALGSDGAVVSERFAEEEGLRVGNTVALRTPTDATVRLAVRGLHDDTSGLFEPITVAAGTLRERFGVRQDGALLLSVAEGEDVGAVQRDVNGVLERGFPTLESQTGDEFIDEAVGQVDQLVNLLYALLSLAVLIALLGIANTLALSIHERTRELGLLRAIGASRRQVRRMVRGEALITALIGAAIGVVVGVAFAALISVPLSDEGFSLVVPVGTLLAVLVLAALCGVLAALNPARPAARTDILGALQYE